MNNQSEFNNSMQNTPQSNPMQGDFNYGYINQQNNYVINSIIDSLSGWMKFIGIYTIVIGAITCLGIITAAIGVPLILAGIALAKASNSLKSYKQSNSPYVLNEIFTSMNKYFKIQGIITIISIVISILYLVFLVFFVVMAFNNVSNY